MGYRPKIDCIYNQERRYCANSKVPKLFRFFGPRLCVKAEKTDTLCYYYKMISFNPPKGKSGIK